MGNVHRVVVKATLTEDGRVAVRIEVMLQLVVRDIVIKGEKDLNDEEINAAMRINPGDFYMSGMDVVLQERIERAYIKEGHLKAQVKISTEPRYSRLEKLFKPESKTEKEETARFAKLESENFVDIIVDINERQRFTLGKVNILGDLGGYEKDMVVHKVMRYREATPGRKGIPIKSSRLDKGIVRLKQFLENAKRREARVPEMDYRELFKLSKLDPTLLQKAKSGKLSAEEKERIASSGLRAPNDWMFELDFEKNTVNINLKLKIGPRVEIGLDEKCFSCAERKWKVNDATGLYDQRRFTPLVVQEYEKRLAEYLQAKGYYKAKVRGRYEEDQRGYNGMPVKRLIFDVDQGPKVKVSTIDFEGNEIVRTRKLLKKMEHISAYREDLLMTDLENVIHFYHERGYLDAKIIDHTVNFDHKKNKLKITVLVEEGFKRILEKDATSVFIQQPKQVFVSDEEAKEKEELQKAVNKLVQKYKKDKAYDPFAVDNTKNLILAKLANRGYLDATLDAEFNEKPPDFDQKVVMADLEWNATLGPRYYVGKIYVQGNNLTKKYVIVRELFIQESKPKCKKGDCRMPYSQDTVIESEQALLKLGLFKSVQIEPVPREEDPRILDIQVKVTERNSGYLQASAGFDSYQGISSAIEIGHRNLAGHGRKISFHVEGTSKNPAFNYEWERQKLEEFRLNLDQRTAVIDFVWPWVARTPWDGHLNIKDEQKHDVSFDSRTMAITIGTYDKLERNFKGDKNLLKIFKPVTVGVDLEIARDFIYNLDMNAKTSVEAGSVQIVDIAPNLLIDARDVPTNPTQWHYENFRIEVAAPFLQSQIAYLKPTFQTALYFPVFKLWGARKGIVYAMNYRVGYIHMLRASDDMPLSRRFFLGGATTIRGFGQDQISPVDKYGALIGGNFMAYTNQELRIPIGETNWGILLFSDAGNVSEKPELFYIDKLRATAGFGIRYLTPIGPISGDYGFKLNRQAKETLGEFYITIGNTF